MEIATIATGTMDSREIASLTGKDHAHVCRDIRTMLGDLGVDESSFGSVYKGDNGENRKCYVLPKRECLILASGYSVLLRVKIIARWAELEAQVPRELSRLEILRMALDAEERVQALEAQRLLDAPKVAAQDLLAGAHGLFGIREAGEQVGLGQKEFVEFLISRKIMYRIPGDLVSGDLVPFQTGIDAGYFSLPTGTSLHGEDAYAWRQAKFTAKGIAWIAEKIGILA